MLDGCVFVQTDHVKAWVLCYRDDVILLNGMYESNELQHMNCNRRKQVEMTYTPGTRPYNDYTDVLKGMHKETMPD